MDPLHEPFDKLPAATHEGLVKLTEDIILPCAVLEDGTRVLTQTEFVKAIGRKGSVKKGEVYLPDRKMSVPVFLSAQNLQPLITEELLEKAKPIPFKTRRNQRGIGYRADFLPEVCDVFLDAKLQGVTTKQQEHIADRCRLLLRAYATVGIIALVDEATGYQAVRARNALELILEKYLSDYKLKWAKRFPDEFYIELFRLRGWKYEDLGYRKRPPVVGKYTDDLVYTRLAPGVLQKLRELNPKTESGHRAAKHHQWLTEDHGVPELRDHLSGVVTLMRVSPSWRNFLRLLNRAYPKPGSQIGMEFLDPEEDDF
jgi:hypothetical protein